MSANVYIQGDARPTTCYCRDDEPVIVMRQHDACVSARLTPAQLIDLHRAVLAAMEMQAEQAGVAA